ncbi:MAG: hypothetical protein RL660_2079 [Bacteroidota bacterium]
MLALLPILSKAQSKVAKDTLTVNGVCGECKERIQEAAYKVKGVKKAEWNKITHVLTVSYQTKKTSLQAIATSLAAAGHDNRLALSTNEQYATLPHCCKYRDGAKCDHD